MARNKKDNQNEGIGIITIIAVVILAILAIYFFWGHSERSIEGRTIATVPTEAPNPIDTEQPINNQKTEGSSINNAP
ncbi:MAG: hypothetical protein LCH30_08740 [Proteobacteria bacterium]|nr:hypothetical protein [Pseudomonadota bacterium]